MYDELVELIYKHSRYIGLLIRNGPIPGMQANCAWRGRKRMSRSLFGLRALTLTASLLAGSAAALGQDQKPAFGG